MYREQEDQGQACPFQPEGTVRDFSIGRGENSPIFYHILCERSYHELFRTERVQEYLVQKQLRFTIETKPTNRRTSTEPSIPPKRFDIFFSLTGGCSGGLGAF